MAERMLAGNIDDIGEEARSLGRGANYFRPDVEVDLVMPQFNSVAPSVIMPIGCFDSDGLMEPAYTLRNGEWRASNYFMILPVAPYFGSADKATMVLFDPFADRAGTYDANTNPYIHLIKTVRKLSNKDPKYEAWKSLVHSGTRDKVLPDNDVRYFFQGLVFQDGDSTMLDKSGFPQGLRANDRYLPIISGSKTLGRTIVSAIRGSMESAGVDLLSGRKSAYFVLYSSQKADTWTVGLGGATRTLTDVSVGPSEVPVFDFDKGSAVPARFAGDSDDRSKDDSEISRWACAVMPVVKLAVVKKGKGQEPDKIDDYLDRPAFPFGTSEPMVKKLAARYRPLNSLFVIPTHEEQLAVIARCLADKPEVLMTAYPEGSEYCTPAILKAIRGRSAGKLGANLTLDDDLSDLSPKLVSDVELGGGSALPGMDKMSGSFDADLDAIFGRSADKPY